jgi:peroxiredoxin Q/BCP
MHIHRTLILILAMLPFSLFADSPLETGATAPSAVIPNHLGEPVDLAALYAAGPVLVYFYPKSDTPGCTKQACNLRDNFADLQDAGLQVVGVSMDSVANQLAFQQKYSLPFILLADENKALGKAFGVNSFAGMAYKRQSFLVVDGKIVWRDLGASPATQSSDALKALQQWRANP